MEGTWRIMIKWDFVSPILRVAKGTVHVDRIQSKIDDYRVFEKHEFTVSVEDHTLGYSNYPDIVTDQMKEMIDMMAKSYFAGVVLGDTSFMWLENNEWKKQMAENMMNPAHKATNKNYRDHYDETFRKDKKDTRKSKKKKKGA